MDEIWIWENTQLPMQVQLLVWVSEKSLEWHVGRPKFKWWLYHSLAKLISISHKNFDGSQIFHSDTVIIIMIKWKHTQKQKLLMNIGFHCYLKPLFLSSTRYYPSLTSCRDRKLSVSLYICQHWVLLIFLYLPIWEVKIVSSCFNLHGFNYKN